MRIADGIQKGLRDAIVGIWRRLPLTLNQRIWIRHLGRSGGMKGSRGNCPDATGSLTPIALTSLGRSGSSAVLGHLGCHPEIAVYHLFSREAHYITYFAQCIDTLSSPSSYLFPLKSGNEFGINLLMGNVEVASTYEGNLDDQWFRQNFVPQLKDFSASALSDYYRWRKQQNSGGEAQFVCEKFSPLGAVDLVGRVFPEMREIILVRDFRDVLCSIIAYNEKRGFTAFGAEQFETLEDYVIQCLAPSADLLLKRWLKQRDRACLIRYEDFILDRKKTLEKVFDYLGTRNRDVEGLMELADRTQNQRQKERHQTSRDAKASIGRYSSELSSKMIALCNESMKNPLVKFGYL